MNTKEYREIINEVRRKKLGQPYVACFKNFIAMIAR
jgi:hypothetical protein